MCSMFLPRSSTRTRRPFSVSSLAAQPPDIPDPTTIASYSCVCIWSSLLVQRDDGRFWLDSISSCGPNMRVRTVCPQGRFLSSRTERNGQGDGILNDVGNDHRPE